MPKAKSYQEFSERHGGNAVEVRGRWLFADGAMSNGRNHIEAPTDPRVLINLQIEYLTAKLHQEEQTFRQSQEPNVEKEVEFTERQACPRVYHGSRWIYENGAQWTAHGGMEPPDDPVAILGLQCEFLSAKLNQEERLFSQCQDYISTQATYHGQGAGPAPAEEAFKDLERFQANILTLRDQLQAKRDELVGLRGPSAEQRYNERRDRQRSTAHEAIQRVVAIEI